jgi:hypothetical protein
MLEATQYTRYTPNSSTKSILKALEKLFNSRSFDEEAQSNRTLVAIYVSKNLSQNKPPNTPLNQLLHTARQ